MVNVILPLTDGIDEAKDFIKSTKAEGIVYYVGLTAQNAGKIKPNKSVKVFVYKNGSKKEEMINSLSKKVGEGKLIILRKLITKQEFNKFITSKKDMAICKGKTRNKFSQFFYNIWQKIVQFVFGINLFDGNTSVVMFCENMADVVKNLSNVSYLTRVNRWKGAEIDEIEISSPPAKMEHDKVKNNLMFFGWLTALVAAIAGATVYFVLCKATFLMGFVWACVLLLALIAFAISAMIYALNIKTGARRFDEAKEEEKK